MSAKKLGVFAAGLAILLAGYVVAQQATQVPQQQREQPRIATPGAAAGSEVDRFLASCWLANNQADVELSQLAAQKAENPQVKQFAEMLAREHGGLIQKLQQIAGQQQVLRTGASPQGETRATVGAAAGDQAVNQLIAIERQIADRRKQLIREKLNEKTGADFDKCFIGAQMASHLNALAALDVISQQSRDELGNLASEARPTIEKHLQEAEKLAMQLEGRAGSPQPGQPGASPTQRPPGVQ